ncbi:unnamed protein product [Rotaria socialis]|uniref:Uncharacterized protein n=1 Tax=Rotaria socialis TaxID=392032 RepID=A0A820U3W9_9BILA|nr:unnamed protein product [Rotaria socialis]
MYFGCYLSAITTTSAATTLTITLNTCTSTWANIDVLYHCYNNCTVQSSYVQYTYSYVAIGNTTRLTFALRQDHYYFALDTISVSGNAAPGTELLINGDFEMGNLTPWLYCNPNNANYAGVVRATNYSYSGKTYGPHTGTHFYLDGAVGSPDFISQTFTTIIGDAYSLSFWLYNPSGGTGVSVDILMST